MGIISLEKSKVWTKKVLDVKYMSASWKKNDGARAKKLEDEKQAKADARQVAVVKEAIRQVKDDQKRASLVEKAIREGRPIN